MRRLSEWHFHSGPKDVSHGLQRIIHVRDPGMPQALRHRGRSRHGIEKTDQIGTAHNSCVMTSKCIGQLFGLLGADKQFSRSLLSHCPSPTTTQNDAPRLARGTPSSTIL
jgi:hypothetical protein